MEGVRGVRLLVVAVAGLLRVVVAASSAHRLGVVDLMLAVAVVVAVEVAVSVGRIGISRSVTGMRLS